MMTEYIEREKVLSKAAPVEGCFSDMISAYDVAMLPAVYVAPVRHGRWVDKPLIKSFKHTNIPVVECSACGIDFCDIINNHYFMYKYCPNCGAKMDGRGEK